MNHLWKYYCALILVLLAHQIQCLCPNNCKCSTTAITCSGSMISYNFKNMDLSSIQTFLLPNTVQEVDLTSTNVPLPIVLNVTKYKSVRTLDLRNNTLSDLNGEEFNQLKELKYLDVSFCDLKSISLKDLSNLETVLMSGNVNLEVTSIRLQNLPKLTNFWAHNMSLTAIPDIYGIPSLAKLYLQGNNIRYIDQNIKKLTNLFELELSNNKLSNTMIGDEAGLYNLRNNTKLTYLYLQQNSLQYIPDIFPGLRYLIISNNNLMFLDLILPKLELIEANNNRLRSFQLHGPLSYEYLDIQLRNNPIDCTCAMAYLRHKPRLGKIEGACHEPKWLRNISLETFAKHSVNPCVNGGRCVDRFNSLGLCECPSNYYGRYCENDVTACSPNPCLNNSTCFLTNKTRNGYFCQCDENHLGLNCEIKIDCSLKPCKNGGTCVQDLKGFHCQCLKSFTGRKCLTIINDKKSNSVVITGVLSGFLALAIVIAMVQCCFIMRQYKQRMSDGREKTQDKLTGGSKLVNSDGEEQNNLTIGTYTALNLRDMAVDQGNYQSLMPKAGHCQNKQPKKDDGKGHSVVEYNYVQLTPSEELPSQQGLPDKQDAGYEITLPIP